MEKNMNRCNWKTIIVLSAPMQSDEKSVGLGDLEAYEFDAKIDGKRVKLNLPGVKLLPQIQKGKRIMAEIDQNRQILAIKTFAN